MGLALLGVFVCVSCGDNHTAGDQATDEEVTEFLDGDLIADEEEIESLDGDDPDDAGSEAACCGEMETPVSGFPGGMPESPLVAGASVFLDPRNLTPAPGCIIDSLAWDFGDGTDVVLSEPSTPVLHTFSTAASRTVSLTAVFTDGCDTVLEYPIEVAQPGPRDVECPAGAVAISLTDVPHEVVSAHAAGTVFCFAAGLHRLSEPLADQAGDVFFGEPGAILSGAVLLTDWVLHAGDTYRTTVPGVTARVNADRAACSCPAQSADGNEYSEYVYVDDAFLSWGADPDALAEGEFYIDYATETVYIGQDPAGSKVELSYVERAFWGRTSDVTVENLVIEKFANPAGNNGAIWVSSSTSNPVGGWTIAHCEIRLNHGRGVRPGTAGSVLFSTIHHNGQMGIGGGNTDGHLAWNDVGHNNVLGFLVGWEAGGVKMGGSSSMVWEYNYSHDNDGPGLWCDVSCGADGVNTLRFNTLVDNTHDGIHYEISQNAVIHNNVALGNGPVEEQWPDGRGAGIIAVASQDVEIYSNYARDNGNGISAISSPRGNLDGLQVHENWVVLRDSLGQETGRWGDPPGTDLLWDGNTYEVCDLTFAYWVDQNVRYAWTDWQALGHDVSGDLLQGTNCP